MRLAILLTAVLFHTNLFAVPIDRIIVVVLENTTYSNAIRQKYLSQLAKLGARMDNYQAITHPSEPNYVAMVSGSTNGVTGDGIYNLSAPSLADLLDSKKISWKTYAEDFPGNCYMGGSRGKYARKHNPLISFKYVSGNPQNCSKIQPAGEFDRDLHNGQLPKFVLYIPNLDNDGHDTGVKFADKWLESRFGKLIADPSFMAGTLFVVTFDEGTSNNQVLTILVGPSVLPSTNSRSSLNHYSLLKLIEDTFQLGNLGKSDASAVPITGIWK